MYTIGPLKIDTVKFQSTLEGIRKNVHCMQCMATIAIDGYFPPNLSICESIRKCYNPQEIIFLILFSFWPHFQNIFDKNAVLMKGGIDGAVGGAEGGAEAIEGGGIVQVLGACGGEADGEDVAQE